MGEAKRRKGPQAKATLMVLQYPWLTHPEALALVLDGKDRPPDADIKLAVKQAAQLMGAVEETPGDSDGDTRPWRIVRASTA